MEKVTPSQKVLLQPHELQTEQICPCGSLANCFQGSFIPSQIMFQDQLCQMWAKQKNITGPGVYQRPGESGGAEREAIRQASPGGNGGRDTSRVTRRRYVNHPPGCMMGNKLSVISHRGPAASRDKRRSGTASRVLARLTSRLRRDRTRRAERTLMNGRGSVPFAKMQRTSLSGSRSR